MGDGEVRGGTPPGGEFFAAYFRLARAPQLSSLSSSTHGGNEVFSALHDPFENVAATNRTRPSTPIRLAAIDAQRGVFYRRGSGHSRSVSIRRGRCLSFVP